MLQYIKWKIKRLNVKTRQRNKLRLAMNSLSLMSIEQKEVFDLVVMSVRKHPERILYDKITGETLILENDRLISLYHSDREYLVSIHNHVGFHSQWFREETFNYLQSIVDGEAHRYRRKLKHEVRMNILNFIRGIVKEKELEDSQ